MKPTNLMRSIILGITMIGCGASQSTTPPVNGENTILGGMSSGGGGTLLQDPIGQEQASIIISKVKDHLRLFVNTLTYLQEAESTDDKEGFHLRKQDFSRIFSDSNLLLEKIDSIKIDDAKTNPCSFQGIDTDGSYHPNQGICISSMRLGAKLDESSAYAQTFALVIHELAHAYGASEEMATKLQRQTLKQLNGQLFVETDAMIASKEAYENIYPVLTRLFPENGLMETIRLIFERNNQLQLFDTKGSLALYSKNQYNIFRAYNTRLLNFAYLGEYLDTASGAYKEEIVSQLDSLFGDQSKIPCHKLEQASIVGPQPKNMTLITDCQVTRLLDSNGTQTTAFFGEKDLLIDNFEQLRNL